MSLGPAALRTAVHTWCSRLLLAGIALASLQTGWRTALESRARILDALHFRSETIDSALDRLYGARFMTSVRRVREEIPESETVAFVDRQPRPQGADYVALYLLAPRKLVRIGRARVESVRVMKRRLPPGARWVVVVGASGEPLELLPADQFGEAGSRAR